MKTKLLCDLRVCSLIMSRHWSAVDKRRQWLKKKKKLMPVHWSQPNLADLSGEKGEEARKRVPILLIHTSIWKFRKIICLTRKNMTED